MTDIVTRKVTASARQAGAQVVHTVYGYDGEIVGTRRSQHRYHYAICRRNGSNVVVSRWSRNATCSGGYFAVEVVDQEGTA